MSLINFEINLVLKSCSKKGVIVTTNVANQEAAFSITDTKFHVPFVT